MREKNSGKHQNQSKTIVSEKTTKYRATFLKLTLDR